MYALNPASPLFPVLRASLGLKVTYHAIVLRLGSTDIASIPDSEIFFIPIGLRAADNIARAVILLYLTRKFGDRQFRAGGSKVAVAMLMLNNCSCAWHKLESASPTYLL